MAQQEEGLAPEEGSAGKEPDASIFYKFYKLEAEAIGGESLASIDVPATSSVAQVRQDLRCYVPCDCKISLVSDDGRELADEEDVGTLADSNGHITVKVVAVPVSKAFLKVVNGRRLKDPATAEWGRNSGRAVVKGAINPGSGVHELRVQVGIPEDFEDPSYVSVGLVPADASSPNARVGPGYAAGEVAWQLRGDTAELVVVAHRTTHPDIVTGDLAGMANDDVLRMEFLSEARTLVCTNETIGKSFTVNEVPCDGPWYFAVGGHSADTMAYVTTTLL